MSIHPNGLLRRPEVILKLTWVGGMAIQILALVPLYDTCVHIYIYIYVCLFIFVLLYIIHIVSCIHIDSYYTSASSFLYMLVEELHDLPPRR